MVNIKKSTIEFTLVSIISAQSNPQACIGMLETLVNQAQIAAVEAFKELAQEELDKVNCITPKLK